VFIASGIVARVLYFESNLSTLQHAASGEYRMYTLHVPPAARTRCKAVSNQGRAQRDSRNTKWIEAERDQAKPVWIDSSTSDGVGTELSTVLALPRCISIRPSLVSTAGTLSESERWLNHYNAALNLHLATGTIISLFLSEPRFCLTEHSLFHLSTRLTRNEGTLVSAKGYT